MKKFCSGLSICAVVGMAFLSAAPATAAEGWELCSRGRIARKAAPLPPMNKAWLEGLNATDIQRNDLDIDVDMTNGMIVGANSMTIKALENNLSEFTFRLADTFTITSLTQNGSNITFTRLDPVTVRAQLSPTVPLNSTFVLRIAYSGIGSAGSGFGSFEWGTRASGARYAFTLSEPFYSYTWWPSKDDNYDKAIDSLAVTVVNGNLVAANGLLISTTPVGATKTKFQYSCANPIVDYLLCFSATNYSQWSQTFNWGSGTMPVRFMINPESDNASNRAGWEACIPMIGTFESIFGPYPFRNEAYGIYQFAFGGGMEHQTFTGQGGFTESLTAHELGHQWWGDMVTCGTWHDIWLNEGFATYCEAMWLEKKPGSTGLPALRTAMNARRPSADTGSVYRYDISTTGTIFSSNYAYRKGGWVLHMLRGIVGDTKFFQILAQWRAQHGYDTAITDDFRDVAEAVYGADLDWFFQPWIYQNGAVSYRRSSTTTTVNGKTYVLLKVDQTQNAAYPTYSMPVEIALGGSAAPARTKIWNNARTQHYVIPYTGVAGTADIDPDNWILVRTESTGTYAPGPPKIVEISPAPGSGSDFELSLFKVTFHTPVAITPADIVLRTRLGDPIDFSLQYDTATNTALIYPSTDLDVDGMELTIRDTVTAVNSNQTLDGEVSGPLFGLPSGNGLQGGQAVFTFGY